MSRSRATLGTLVYLLAAVPFAAAGVAALAAGWALCAGLAVTPLVVPALSAFRAAVGALARADGALAGALLGEPVRPPLSSPGPPGFWRSARNVLADEAFWKQQVYVLQRSVVGLAIAVVELALLGGGAFATLQPALYRITEPSLGTWRVDSLGRAALLVPPGVLAVAVGVALVAPFGAVARSARRGLLGASAPAAVAEVAHTRRMRVRWLVLHAMATAALAAVTTLIWLLTTRAYFWPAWPILVFGVPLAIHAWVDLVDLRPAVARRQRLTRGIAIHEGVSAAIAAFFALVWALAGFGYFWPVWPILVLLAVLVAHAGVVLGPAIREGALAERIASLETSRAGAVEEQDAQLRRIERDLHDGAQARLVALGMSLGMAEQKLVSDPGAAQELLADARRGAHEALQELRDLARGIHPPLLADRGLEAAVTALASRTPLHVRVTADLERRPPAPVESAAYFVVSEALANAGKHARAEHVDIVVRCRRNSLLVEVVDDGVGGADRGGSGLAGLARRVEALDGRLDVTSPAGGPTTVRAVMPCAS